MRHANRWDWVLHVVLPLTVGSVLYLGYRSDTLLVWQWAEVAGLDGVLYALRFAVTAVVASVPEPVAFTLPDGLWVYAMSFAVSRLWARGNRFERAGWLAIPVLLGVGAELGQAIGFVPGTFDPADLVVCVVATGFGFRIGVQPATRHKRTLGARVHGEERP